jgi:hypothetical protein
LLACASLVLTALPLPAQPGFGRGDPQAGRYGWLSSLEAGKSQARQSGKPLMVVLRCVP